METGDSGGGGGGGVDCGSIVVRSTKMKRKPQVRLSRPETLALGTHIPH